MPSSSSNFEAHRGDDFYKKLMFYEKNSSSNNNNNGYYQSANSPRRSSFQQTPPLSIPSTSKTFNNLMNRQTQQIASRPNLASASPLNKHSTTNKMNLADRMQRSKSYNDLFDPPSPSSTNAHHIYYQSQSSGN
jgi:hypothetical protein